MIDHTHSLALRSWVVGADAHPEFPVQNLPLGVFSPGNEGPRIGTAIGDHILDLSAIAERLPQSTRPSMREATLNGYLALPSEPRQALRRMLSGLLSDEREAERLGPFLHLAADCRLHLPAAVGDYTDFYAGIHHASNVGALFRPDQPLLPNYKHVPIGYHGRASSIRVSETPVHRPLGQTRSAEAEAPSFGPTRRLDYELELGIWIAQGNAPGEPIPIAQAGERIAGFCLLNDWSARDIQAWEYQPLGPFLAKSFATTVSPWLITREALAPYRIPQPARPPGDPAPLPYLWDEHDQEQGAFAITLEVHIETEAMRHRGEPAFRVSRTSAARMYWTPAQLVAHHASNGCNLRPGDLLGTGTISGPEAHEQGSLLELTNGGLDLLPLPAGGTRGFLHDGDRVTLNGYAERPGFRRIGFGGCSGLVVPAIDRHTTAL